MVPYRFGMTGVATLTIHCVVGDAGGIEVMAVDVTALRVVTVAVPGGGLIWSVMGIWAHRFFVCSMLPPPLLDLQSKHTRKGQKKLFSNTTEDF